MLLSGSYSKGGDSIFKDFFKKRIHNTQPENARIAHRAVKLARLAEINNVSLYGNGESNLAVRLAGITDRELDTLSVGVSPIVGCPANIIPLFAGYSQTCDACPYFARDHTGKQNDCALKED